MLSRCIRFAASLLMAMLAATSQAQSAWPNQTIRLAGPFPPGGTTGQVARLVAPHLQQSLGVSVIVENRGGASGTIGALAVARSPADGNTFLVVFDTHGVNPSLVPNLQYDTLKSFSSVMLIGTSPMVITAHPSTPYKTFKDVLAAANAKDRPVPYGTIGAGSLAHLTMTALANRAKVSMTHVGYKGGGPLVVDAVAGHVPVAIASVALLMPNIGAGKIRPLAVTSARRSPLLPDVPTVAEAGLPGLEAEGWWGLVAPAGTPEPVIARMNTEVANALRVPSVRGKLEQQGLEIRASAPADFDRFLASEVDRWAKVVKENGITQGE